MVHLRNLSPMPFRAAGGTVLLDGYWLLARFGVDLLVCSTKRCTWQFCLPVLASDACYFYFVLLYVAENSFVSLRSSAIGPKAPERASC
jgi:hypothetical protein